METTNENTGAKKAPRNDYQSLQESVTQMKLTFTNASMAGIYEVLLTVGYTQEKLNAMLAKVSVVEERMLDKTKEDADQVAEQEQFDQQRETIHNAFITHRSLAKVLLKNDVHASVSLQLNGNTPKAYTDWKDMISNFYTQIGNQPALLAKTSTVGITAAVATAQLAAVADLEATKSTLKKVTAEAQAATQARDQAFDDIHPQYLEYVKYAKILLADSPLLKALGL